MHDAAVACLEGKEMLLASGHTFKAKEVRVYYVLSPTEQIPSEIVCQVNKYAGIVVASYKPIKSHPHTYHPFYRDIPRVVLALSILCYH